MVMTYFKAQTQHYYNGENQIKFHHTSCWSLNSNQAPQIQNIITVPTWMISFQRYEIKILLSENVKFGTSIKTTEIKTLQISVKIAIVSHLTYITHKNLSTNINFKIWNTTQKGNITNYEPFTKLLHNFHCLNLKRNWMHCVYS